MNQSDAPKYALEKIVPGSVYRSLLQLAVLGSELSLHGPAEEIGEALRALRPDLPQAGIVLAMNDFCAGKVDQGIGGLQAVLEEFPDSQLAKAMLAVCLKIDERSGWQHLFESVIEDGRDEYAIGLACEMLGRTGISALADGQAAPAAAPTHAMWA